MPDENTAGGETPPEPTTTPPAPTEPTGEPFDKERAMSLIQKLREELKQSKPDANELKAAKERISEMEKAQMTESERLQRERDEAISDRKALEATNQDNAVRLAVFSLQQDKGIADADLALAALDRTKIEYGDDGRPTNIGELVDDLLERKPLLRATATTPPKPAAPKVNGGEGTGSAPSPDLTAEELHMAQLTGASPERVALWKKVSAGELSWQDAIKAETSTT